MTSILVVLEVPIREVKANLIQTLNMCFALSKKKVTVKLIVLIQISQEEAIKVMENIIPNFSEYFEVNFIDFKPTRSFFTSQERFRSLKKHIDLSFEYIFTRSPLVSLYVTRKGKKLIYEAHNAYFTKQVVLNWYYRWRFKNIIKKDSFKMFLSISENLKNYWINNNILKSKSLALHDGTSAEVDVIKPNMHMPFENSKRYKVLYSGSLYKDRGIDRILFLARDFPNLDFIVIGGPNNNAKQFEEEARAMGMSNIVFLGYLDHKYVPFFLNNSDILLALWSKNVPTIDYCSPLKLFEYMHSNKLIIADGFITIKEVLTDGENALLCEPDNYESLRDRLGEVYDSPDLLAIGRNNRDLIKSKYSWVKRAEFILEKLD